MSTGVYIKLASVAAIWGGTFTAGRIIAAHLSPLVGASGRYCIASLAFVAVVLIRQGRFPRLTGAEAFATMILGATGIFLYNLGFFYALRELPAGRASLIVALNPIVTLLGAIVFLGERLTSRRVAGIALAFSGAAVVLSKGDLRAVAGVGLGLSELAMFGAVCAWAAYSLIGRRAMTTLSPMDTAAYATLWGTGFLLIAAVGTGASLPPERLGLEVTISLVFVGVFGTALAFTWFNDGIKAIGPSRAAVFTNLVPVFGVVEAAILLREPILPSMLIGGVLTIAGVALANRPAPAASV